MVPQPPGGTKTNSIKLRHLVLKPKSRPSDMSWIGGSICQQCGPFTVFDFLGWSTYDTRLNVNLYQAQPFDFLDQRLLRSQPGSSGHVVNKITSAIPNIRSNPELGQ
jgi:hypothetical protein